MRVMKASWSTYDGDITFVLPDCTSLTDSARHYDHPNTVCEVLDLCAKLSPHERRRLLIMIATKEKAAT